MTTNSFTIIALSVALFSSSSHASKSVQSAIEIPQAVRVLKTNVDTKLTLPMTLRFEELRRIAGLDQIIKPRKSTSFFDLQMAATNLPLSKSILLKNNFQVSDALNWQLYRHKQGFFIQLPLASKQVSIFFLGFDETEALNIVNSFRDQYAVHNYNSLSPFQLSFRRLISEVHARSEVATPDTDNTTSTLPQSDNSERFEYAAKALDKCGDYAQQGALSAIESPFTQAKQTAIDSYRNFGKVWDNTLRDWEAFKNAVINYEKFFADKKDAFLRMSNEEKGREFCKFVGGGLATGGPAAKAAKSLVAPKSATRVHATHGTDHKEAKHNGADRKTDGKTYLLAGSAAAEEAVKLADSLRRRNIDPKVTHIPEFAEKIKSHNNFARENIKEQSVEVRTRLKILDDFEAEAAQRVKEGRVSYEWWHDYNYRLSILLTPAAKRTADSGGFPDLFAADLLKTGNWKTAEGFRKSADLQEQDAFSRGFYSPAKAAARFPDRMVIPTIEPDIGIAALNQTFGKVDLLGLIGKKIDADGQAMYPDRFFRHDEGHAKNSDFVRSRYELPANELPNMQNNYMQYRDQVPTKGGRRGAFEFAYFMANHEIYSADSIVRNGGRINRLESTESVQLLRDPKWHAASVPDWATKDDASAKIFLRMAQKELEAFSKTFYKKPNDAQ